MKHIYGLLFLFMMSIACDKEPDPNSACDLTFPFSDVEWEATTVQPSECKWMLFKYEYSGKYYYSVGNHCVDMAAFIGSCEGVNICNSNATLCRRVLDKGTLLGIVAVEKE